MLIASRCILELGPEKPKRQGKIVGKLDRSRLGKLAEQMSIPWRELNKITKEIVGKEDCSKLTVNENRKVIEYLKRNQGELGKKYRRMIWNGR